MSEFCRLHAFYDCPVCRGEQPVWTIPIVNDRTGEVTGQVTVRGDEVIFAGAPEFEFAVPAVPSGSQRVRDVASSEVAGSGARHGESTARGKPVRRPTTSRSETRRPTRKQVAEVRALFSSSILEEPSYLEAAARGRRVYEEACLLAAAEGISLDEALLQVAGR